MNKIEENTIKKRIYAAKHKEIKVRENSTSGGIFYSLANAILETNGKVYGTMYTDDLEVVFSSISNKDEIHKLMGVKYVQSYLGNTYKEILQDLKDKKIVLFVGTPCQCKGLINYIKAKKYSTDNLYVCDLVCHGSPEPRIWRDYLRFIESKYNSKVDQYKFRYKKISWRGQNIYVKLKNGKELINTYPLLSYTNLFSKDLILRNNCFECKYANMDRVGNVTIGDCWGIEKINPAFDDSKGISLIIVNDKKGNELLDKIKPNLDIFEIKTDDYMQKNLLHPTNKPKQYKKFWNEYESKGYKYVAKKYSIYGMKNKFKYVLNKIKYKIKRRK